MARCTNCHKNVLSPTRYDVSQKGILVTLYYTGDMIGGQAITAPSRQVHIFSKLRPEIIVDGGDVQAIMNLGCFRLGK